MTVVGYFERGDFGLDIKTIRNFSALMIFLLGGCRSLRALLIMVRLVPVFFAHAVWPPTRSTSERSKRMTSISSRNLIYNHPPQLAASFIEALKDLDFYQKKPRRLGRGCCSILEGNHRPLGGGQCSQQRYLTTSRRAEQINFCLRAASVGGL